MKALGLDIGSLTTKAVILDTDKVIASVVIGSADEAEISANQVIRELKEKTGLDGEFYIVSTGMGGKSVASVNQQKTITTCLARGTNFIFPSARMAIDMGAESSTVIKINDRGRPTDWANHDKCASGTGIFLQQMAKLSKLSLEEMSELSFKAKSPAEITNTCAVFAESEVISHVHRMPPTPKEDIIAGIYGSVVSRLLSLCKRLGIQKDIAVSGGVALNRGLVEVLGRGLGCPLLVPEQPQIVAALGAAIIARENMDGKNR